MLENPKGHGRWQILKVISCNQSATDSKTHYLLSELRQHRLITRDSSTTTGRCQTTVRRGDSNENDKRTAWLASSLAHHYAHSISALCRISPFQELPSTGFRHTYSTGQIL